MRVFGPQEFLLVTFPGTAKTSRLCSRAQRAVMRVPLYSAVSTTRTPKGDFTDDAIGNGKILRAGESAHRKLGNQRSADGEDLIGEPGVFLGINDIRAGVKHRNCFSLGCNRTPMSGSIHSARESTEDHEAPPGELAGQPLGHANAVRSWMTGADHGNAGLRECCDVAAHVEDKWRIVDLAETGWVGWGVEGNTSNARRWLLSRFRHARVRQILRCRETERRSPAILRLQVP